MRHYTVQYNVDVPGEYAFSAVEEDYQSLGVALGRYDELTRKYINDTSVKVSERVLTNKVIFTAQKGGKSVEIKLTIWA